MYNNLSELFQNYENRTLSIMTQIDEILNGGIQIGYLTEIYGEAGTGKTHICMALMINTILNNIDQKVIYISTSKQIQYDRFLQLISILHILTIQEYRLGKKSKDKIQKINTNCIFQHLNDTKSFEEYIYQQLPLLLEQHKCVLVIIDNITYYFQEQNILINSMQKISQYHRLSTHFKNLSKKYNFATLFINNTVASINTGKTVAGLGPKWGEMIDERLIIERKGMRRILKIDLSHRLPFDECNFSITENGLLPIID